MALERSWLALIGASGRLTCAADFPLLPWVGFCILGFQFGKIRLGHTSRSSKILGFNNKPTVVRLMLVAGKHNNSGNRVYFSGRRQLAVLVQPSRVGAAHLW